MTPGGRRCAAGQLLANTYVVSALSGDHLLVSRLPAASKWPTHATTASIKIKRDVLSSEVEPGEIGQYTHNTEEHLNPQFLFGF